MFLPIQIEELTGQPGEEYADPEPSNQAEGSNAHNGPRRGAWGRSIAGFGCRHLAGICELTVRYCVHIAPCSKFGSKKILDEAGFGAIGWLWAAA